MKAFHYYRKMTYLILLVSLLLVGVSKTDASDSAVFISEPVFEFGHVKSGEIIDHVFIVQNDSPQTIDIVAVKPSCGCTTMGKWDKTILSGEAGNIPVKLNTTNMHGKLNKAIRIYSSAAPTEPLVASMKGSVFLAIDVRPHQLRFAPLRDKNNIQSMTVQIESNLEKPLRLKLTENKGPLFQKKLKTIQKGKEFELIIKTTQALKWGWNKEVIRLETNSLEQSIVEVPVFCYVHKPLECRPGLLTLPPGNLKRDIHKTVLFSINQPGMFKLPVVSSPLKLIMIKLAPTQKEKEYRLDVVFPKGLRLADEGKTEIQISVIPHQGEKTIFTLPIEQLQARP